MGLFMVAKELVVLVDENDNEIGVEEKINAHRKGLLHRAFSIFVFNSKNELLLQKRAADKYHSGGLWSNTCCSHPRPGENLKDAAHRRLQEEMGFDCSLREVFSFLYKKSFDNGLTEHELDHVFFGKFDGIPKINNQEVDDYKLINFSDLRKDVKNNPSQYSFWFRLVLGKVAEKL
jgi:isopentenyl-diphosphate Delta-isomerase